MRQTAMELQVKRCLEPTERFPSGPQLLNVSLIGCLQYHQQIQNRAFNAVISLDS